MKKAILYARVSTAIQEKERTIESQIAALKKQIVTNGDVLVKEYIDDGCSGAKLNRPAMDELRRDLTTDLFDTVYFLNTDRIARNVTYQTIIISEILKAKKQIIINGKDYVHNPENKFSLTILGAVSELERAKILERNQRGKRYRLRQGFLLSNGHNVYGYDYFKRTHTAPARLEINKKEAEAVRHMFELYAQGASWKTIARSLEDKGYVRKSGKKLWEIEQMRAMLKNHTYRGERYFNTRSLVKEPSNPLRGVKYGKRVFKDKSEWIGVKVPAIVSQELFDKVQKRLEQSQKEYRNPRQTQLLSGLVSCGSCGSSLVAYQRYIKQRWCKGAPLKIYHKAAYRCDRRNKSKVHSKNSDVKTCHNPEVSVKLLDPCVLNMAKKFLLDPEKLQQHLILETGKSSVRQKRLEKQIKNSEKMVIKLQNERKDLIDLYAAGTINRSQYADKCKSCDKKMDELKSKRNTLVKSVPALHKKAVIESSIKHYCDTAKARFEQCYDFDTRRQFLLDHIDKVEYHKGEVKLHGSIPIQLKAYNDPDQTSEASKIRFCVEGEISKNKYFNKES